MLWVFNSLKYDIKLSSWLKEYKNIDRQIVNINPVMPIKIIKVYWEMNLLCINILEKFLEKPKLNDKNAKIKIIIIL